MSDVVEFLTARLDEDEAAAEAHLNEVALAIYNAATAHPRRKPCNDFTTLPPLVQTRYRALALESQPASARVLAEAKAKRAIVALHQPEEVEYLDGDGQDRMSTDCTTCDTGGCANTWPCDTLKLLATPYDQHPDYDEAWRPS